MALVNHTRKFGTLAALCMAATLVLACRPEGGVTRAPPLRTTQPRGAHPTLLVLLPDTPETRGVYASLSDELADEFRVVPLVVDASTDLATITQAIASETPEGMVLMNNPTVRLYRRYRGSLPNPSQAPPAVIVMASFLEEVLADLPKTTGIAYEIPGVTSFSEFRTMTRRRMERIGVVHRAAFAGYVDKQRKLAEREGFELIAREFERERSTSGMREAIAHLRDVEGVDALWAINDNALLSRELIMDGWLEELRDYPLPVIVGVDALVDARVHFGTFAVLPDHTALGSQTAQLVFDLHDSGWNADAIPVEQPISVETVLDLEQARQRLHLREDRLDDVDRLVD